MKDSLALPFGVVATACALLGAVLVPQAVAQPAAPPDAAPGNASASERASRETDKVFKWILMHSDKPRKATVSGKETPPVAAAAPPKEVAPAHEARPSPKLADVPASKSPVHPAVREAPAASATSVAPEANALVPAQASGAASAVESPPTDAALASLLTRAVPLAPTPATAEPEDDSDETLVLLKQVDPEFSSTLMRTLRKGTVQVKFTIQPDGAVGAVEVVKTTSARINGAATAAVQQWRFGPLHHAQTGIVELGFNLD
jgi:TonB family protein